MGLVDSSDGGSRTPSEALMTVTFNIPASPLVVFTRIEVSLIMTCEHRLEVLRPA
jgi:hypothetical protein